MGKAGKWLRYFLASSKKKNKEKEKNGNPASPSPSPTKEKKRWSFRRSVRAGEDSSSHDLVVPRPICGVLEAEFDQNRHAVAVAAATAAAADAAVAAAQAAAAVLRLTAVGVSKSYAVEDDAAIKVQAAFRAYLARKALRALKGLVKLQALVRGHLVRRQATATLRCMQALIAVQARARAQRIKMIEESENISSHRQSSFNKRSPQHPKYRQSYVYTDKSIDDNVKIVEMDFGESRANYRNSYSIAQSERRENRYTVYGDSCAHSKLDPYQEISPAPSALTDTTPRGCSGYLEDFSFSTAQSSPHYFQAISVTEAQGSSSFVSQEESTYKSMFNEYPFFPSYMANTKSSKAKVRSQSAPKQRPDSYERQPSRRRQSVEGKNIPRSVRMQRSSSHIGASVDEYQYPWSIRLDGSNVSLKNSECGSTSTVLTGGYYNRSLVSF